ncbi:MAG: SUF system Fe-S cluster assembly regulator [Cycloclasticus pugetii]|jgi:FeS assembly SUF system regulator|uniref:Rrf2 family transcriptional regulator n=2 Tax=Cycloclasticus TaxID=34067 RepID=S5TXJ3_9GAMM|nr:MULTISPECIES: SUF system Fe-S cluster assembly regulator [Cycloclasticus]AFT67087.1 Iron sulfur cluster assembly transcriptional regulator [Cycloclasticus sp. P1]AGS39875.1 Rrf2 family transcriptional regulator [Cycloclasticus zancles 78-ME]ATI03310.1 SUF system Fe-S cluster assembly regulator [Cycloclasticus sp. PY97N]EPD12555.1 iron sulfur cluster assembly transcriptional regulator [Cycloclasticus pugetii]MBV1897935.1 SUF system Fe-S cluster assembly regulator [Cycloclasticus sp.]|tara:strand:- start:924 stop:1394 length:471 start_codon:yes stop_codon:yes gene_type:complete
MLRVSKLTDYASVILTHIAHHPDALHAASDLTNATGVALPTVSKILKLLTKNNILVSHRGSKGGYALVNSPSETNVADIITAIEGPISMTECSTISGLCEQEASCEVKGNWHLINRAVYTAIEAVSLADMITPVRQQTVNFSVPEMVKTSDLKVES